MLLFCQYQGKGAVMEIRSTWLKGFDNHQENLELLVKAANNRGMAIGLSELIPKEGKHEDYLRLIWRHVDELGLPVDWFVTANQSRYFQGETPIWLLRKLDRVKQLNRILEDALENKDL